MSKYTPPPWEAREIHGAGIEIYAPVHLVDTIEWPRAAPTMPIMLFQLTEPAGHKLIACERWVQFEPEGWHEMQWANALLMQEAPNLLEKLEEARDALCVLNSEYVTNLIGEIDALVDKAKGKK